MFLAREPAWCALLLDGRMWKDLCWVRIFLVLVILAIAAVATLKRSRGKKPEEYQNDYDRYYPYWNGQNWSQYYDRNR